MDIYKKLSYPGTPGKASRTSGINSGIQATL
jgi:hypothetical protein